MVILAIVCSSAYTFASELVVKGKIDAPFSVYVNGEKYYSYKNKVDVSYIPSGRYNLEIYTEGAYSELLYDYTINIPRRSTVYATFTGDNRMYISTEKDAPATIIVDLTPYPHRYHKPVPVYHSTPKPAPKHHRLQSQHRSQLRKQSQLQEATIKVQLQQHTALQKLLQRAKRKR